MKGVLIYVSKRPKEISIPQEELKKILLDAYSLGYRDKDISPREMINFLKKKLK